MSLAPVGEIKIVADRLTKRFGAFVAVNRGRASRRGAAKSSAFSAPTAAGKSTTIRILCGLLSADGGRGGVAASMSRYPETRARAIGYMSQGFSLYNDLSVIENLRFFGGVYGVTAQRLNEPAAIRRRMAGLRSAEPRHRPLGRLEAASGAGCRVSRAGDPLPRRADLGRRSELAPPLLAPHLRPRRRRRVRRHHDALHGRSRILRIASR